MERPSVFEYNDYRLFLKALFAYRKAASPRFSHRHFARLAGFASPNFVKLVMEGNRNLTSDSIGKIARGFKLKKPEREFFENLVFMNQASSISEKDHYYRKMIEAKTSSAARKMDIAEYEYFSRWYLPVIRELAVFDHGRLTAGQIAGRLNPPVKIRDVEAALEKLTMLGLIRKDPDGRWVQTDRVLTTGPRVKSILAVNFHHEMIRMAGESLGKLPANERNISAVTLSVQKDRFAELVERIAAFRKSLLNEFAMDEDPDQVVQVNIQAFLMTKPGDEGELA